MRVGRGDAEELAEPAVAMHPHDLELAAHVRPAHRAGVAGAAGDHGIDRDPLPHPLGRHSLAHRRDLAKELVADDPGIDHEGVLAVEDVHVGSADPRVAHAHSDLPGTRLGDGALDESDPVRLFDRDTAHRAVMIYRVPPELGP